jgi:hypothetical protein
MRKKFLFDVDGEEVIIRTDKKKGLVYMTIGESSPVVMSPDNCREFADYFLNTADKIDFDEVVDDDEDEDGLDFSDDELSDLSELDEFSFSDD